MRTAVARVKRVAAMPTIERTAFCLALVLVASARLLLFALPSRVTLRIVRRIAEQRARSIVTRRPTASHIAWAVVAASRLVPRHTCLTQAVAAKLLLTHYGFEVRLCLGVAHIGNREFTAHAWVEYQGRVIIGGAESATFARFPSLSATLPRKRGAVVR